MMTVGRKIRLCALTAGVFCGLWFAFGGLIVIAQVLFYFMKMQMPYYEDIWDGLSPLTRNVIWLIVHVEPVALAGTLILGAVAVLAARAEIRESRWGLTFAVVMCMLVMLMLLGFVVLALFGPMMPPRVAM